MQPTRGWYAPARSALPRDGRHAARRTTRPDTGARTSVGLRLCCLLVSFIQVLCVGTSAADSVPTSTSQASEADNPPVGGPFPVRSLSPLMPFYFQFAPERAIPVSRGAWKVRFDLVEANYLARDVHDSDSFLFDYELTHANLALQYGALDHLAIGLEIPLLYTWKGFLDEPIKGFEDATGFERTIRFERPQHLFSYELNKDGERALRGTSGALGIGDIAMTVKALWQEEDGLIPAVAGRFALKLPTGQRDRALGSGEVDVALGLALEKTFGPVRLYFNTGLTIPTGEPFAGTGIDSLPILSGFLTGEYHLTRHFSLLLQLSGMSPPVRNTDLDIGNPVFEILAGFNWVLPGLPVVWQAGFMEDLNNTNRTADFALFMSWTMFFGRRASTAR